MRGFLTGAVLAALAAVQAHAAAGPVAAGHRIAIFVCSACHLAAADQPFPPMLEAPPASFVSIANRPGVSARSLQRFIAQTHWDQRKIPMTMPDMMLTAEQRRDVTSYILSLRRRP